MPKAALVLGGTRRLLADFASRIIVASMSYYRLPGATPHQEHTLSGDELIVSVEIPAGAYTSRSHYLKVRDRESYEFALVSVAAALHEEGGVIRAARLAAGGVGTVPWRLQGVEQAFVGQPNGERAWRIAADLSVEGALPLPNNTYSHPT